MFLPVLFVSLSFLEYSGVPVLILLISFDLFFIFRSLHQLMSENIDNVTHDHLMIEHFYLPFNL